MLASVMFYSLAVLKVKSVLWLEKEVPFGELLPELLELAFG